MYFHSKRSDNTKNFSSPMKLDVRLEQIRSCIVLKDAIAKNFVANEHHSFTSVFTFSVVVVVDLPIDCILSFLFPAETDVLVPVFSQSTDVVVVNFVVVLKFPIISTDHTLSKKIPQLHQEQSIQVTRLQLVRRQVYRHR